MLTARHEQQRQQRQLEGVTHVELEVYPPEDPETEVLTAANRPPVNQETEVVTERAPADLAADTAGLTAITVDPSAVTVEHETGGARRGR